MLPKTPRIWAFLCLVLVLQLAAAQNFRVVRRDDGAVATSTIPPSSPEPTPTKKPDGNDDGKKDTPPNDQTDASQSASRTKTTGNTKSATTATSSSSPTNTLIFDGPLDNSTFFNATIPEGQLPIEPVITPGWAVAGVVMIITGLVYTLIGIKNRWIHSFFSTAYVTALGITLLIIYVMSVPISNAVQGGYVVAIIMSGCALGAASTFFKELTEGLGCALGGFSFSMWLLCLIPGGLLQTVPSKAIFITCFTVAGFAFYFSRWTRDISLIILISFGGATVTVLGIDCFSRAGLKEFWAYIWNLNDNLFPLGADTYPVTKGIRVETAAIVIICLFGIVSQIKLWRIVKENREKNAAERAEGQRNLEEEEENVGRQIEESTARDRREWERVYGDETLTNDSPSHYSGDNSSEKRLKGSQAGSICGKSKGQGIEMADMSDSSQTRVGTDGLLSTEGAEDGKITVRVAVDEIAELPAEDVEEVLNEKAAPIEDPNAGVSRTTTDGKCASHQQAVAPAPTVVPLPFKVPEEEEDTKSEGDRSSVATFADEEDVAPTSRNRGSLVKRISRNSVSLFRSFSQRSKHPAGERQLCSGRSSEELVEPDSYPHDDDDRSSLAVTVDDESVSGANRHSVMSVDNRKSIEITAELGKAEKDKTNEERDSTDAAQNAESAEKSQAATEKVEATEAADGVKSPSADASEKVDGIKVEGGDSTEAEEAADASEKVGGVKTESGDSKEAEANAEAKAADASAAAEGSNSGAREVPVITTAEAPAEATPPEPAAKPKSVASAVSGPASLTKDHLPKSLSKVALSYRTNEWAKHLGHADTPEPDEIYVAPMVQSSHAKEVPRSVDVEDLQKTAEDGTLPPAIMRSDSQYSQISSVQPSSIIGSRKEDPANLILTVDASLDTSPNASPGSPPVGLTVGRTVSMGLRRTSSGFAPIAEEHDAEMASPTIPGETSELGSVPLTPMSNQNESSPRLPVPGVVSYASPQTLLGQRDTFLRNKSQGNLLANISEPPAAMSAPASDAGSLHNYPVYAAAFSSDVDDLPLSHRKEMMRQSSMMSFSASNSALNRPNSGIENSENTAFNSHQPKRIPAVPTAVAREAMLANFRHSVAQDLRPGNAGPANSGRETPFASTSNLLGGVGTTRSMLMEQKEAEAQRREMQRREKEWQDRLFEERMRNGDLLEAHREVLRKMQSSAK